MKRLRAVLSMICFIVGFLTIIVGVIVTLILLSTFSVANMNPVNHRPFSELVLTAAPGVVVALAGVALLLGARSLDEHGPVRRYGKRKRS